MVAVVTDLRHPGLARLWSRLDVLGPFQYVDLPAVACALFLFVLEFQYTEVQTDRYWINRSVFAS